MIREGHSLTRRATIASRTRPITSNHLTRARVRPQTMMSLSSLWAMLTPTQNTWFPSRCASSCASIVARMERSKTTCKLELSKNDLTKCDCSVLMVLHSRISKTWSSCHIQTQKSLARFIKFSHQSRISSIMQTSPMLCWTSISSKTCKSHCRRWIR